MLLLCLCALAGAYSLAAFPQLPPPMVFHTLLAVAFACCLLRYPRPVAFFLLGFSLMGLTAAEQKAGQLASPLQGSSLAITARIVGFPNNKAGFVNFVAQPLNRDDLPVQVRLTWMDPATVPAIGETWRLNVRLKRPRGYVNPGGFGFEEWLFRQGIGASGYVLDDPAGYRILGEPIGLIDRVRNRFVYRVARGLPQDDASAVLMAIGVGARQGIDSDDWDLYARTGTSHLMAISGLHIGLAAGCAYFLCWFLFAPFCRRRNLRDLSILGAAFAAFVYASLSGFAVPARRAVLMVLVAASFALMRRRLRPTQMLALPCALIFLADPLAIMAPGFKLSFAAVAILFTVAGQHVRHVQAMSMPTPANALTGLGRLARLQTALLCGLFPLTVLIFDRVSLVSPVTNLLVLPIFNFVTVPLTLAGALLDGPFDRTGMTLLGWAHSSISGILWLVGVAGEQEAAGLRTRELGALMTAVAIMPLLYVVLPPGWPGRKLALVAMVCVLTYRPPHPPPGCLDYHVLDVGQGLSVVLRTRQQALLFDTGPSFLNGGDAAELVVLPFLYRFGIDRLDKLVISHGDLDHAGGANSIVAGIEVGEVLVGERIDDLAAAQRECVAGQQWRWDSISFLILHPRMNAPLDRNNSSCVLLLEIGGFRILLTGDIESPAEKLLLHRDLVGATDIVIVPHHGSMTSSSDAFVDRTRPGLAIVSAGFGNQWGLPRPAVVDRWAAAGAAVVNTATSGAVSQRICRHDVPGEVRLERHRALKFWHDVPPAPP